MANIPFMQTDWNKIEPEVHPGEKGTAYWRTKQCGEIRVRMVEYSPGYIADHWCEKGHVLLVLEGELETELADGRKYFSVRGQVIRWRTAPWRIGRSPRPAPNCLLSIERRE
jgi:quercetin dioxygenase-like cupin family protein